MGGGGEGEGSDGGGSVTAVTINITCTDGGTKFAVKVSLDSSVGSFKSLLAKNCEIPVEQQLLIYKGGILKDDQTLKSYGLEAEHTVHLVRRAVAVASDNIAEEGATGGSGDSSGFREIDQIQQQLIPNPNTFVEMLEQDIMHDLDDLRDVIRSQLIDRDPERASILNDPSIFNQTMGQIIDRDPEIGRIFIDPIFNHRTEVEIIALQQPIFSRLAQQQGTRSAGPMGGETGARENIQSDTVRMNMSSGVGTPDLTTTNSNTNVVPEQLYASQLAQLQEIGFFPDTRRNLEALEATRGNVPAAAVRLFGP